MTETLLAVNVQTASRMLSVSERMVWYLIRKGEIRVMRLGKRTLISVRELESVVEKKTAVESTDEARRVVGIS